MNELRCFHPLARTSSTFVLCCFCLFVTRGVSGLVDVTDSRRHTGDHDGCEALSQEHPAAAPQILVH